TMARLRTLKSSRLKHLDTRTTLPMPKEVDEFYRSSPWLELLARIIAKRGRRCEDPKCETPNGPWPRIIGDHVEERRDGGADLDETNVMLRCIVCHNRKTADVRAARHARIAAGTQQR